MWKERSVNIRGGIISSDYFLIMNRGLTNHDTHDLGVR